MGVTSPNTQAQKVKLSAKWTLATASPFVKPRCIPSPFLGPGKPAFVCNGGNPQGPAVSDFDEMTIPTAEESGAVRLCECEGGVEGGVSNSSDDEKESAHEEVSETREGARQTVEKDVLCPEGAGGVGTRVCDGDGVDWDAILRRRVSLSLRSERTVSILVCMTSLQYIGLVKVAHELSLGMN